MAIAVGFIAYTIARVPADAGSGGRRVIWLAVTGGVAAVGGLIYLLVFRWMGGIEPQDRVRIAAMRLPLRGLILRVLGPP